MSVMHRGFLRDSRGRWSGRIITLTDIPHDGLSGTLARDIDLQPALQLLDTWTFEPSDSSLESDGFSLVYDDSAPIEQAHRWILSYNAAPAGAYFEAGDYYFNDRNATSINWLDCRLVDEATATTIEFSVQCTRDTEMLGYKYCNKTDMLLQPAGDYATKEWSTSCFYTKSETSSAAQISTSVSFLGTRITNEQDTRKNADTYLSS